MEEKFEDAAGKILRSRRDETNEYNRVCGYVWSRTAGYKLYDTLTQVLYEKCSPLRAGSHLI
eukprot:4214348-Pyramimonas_sp.AAC.1